MSKPTHIILSIKDIEKKMSSLKKDTLEHLSNSNESNYSYYKGQKELFEQLLFDSKQISLSEEDINTEAYNHLAGLKEEELEFGAAELTVNAYKQALLNLKS